jgi:hypothetical protein
MLSSMRPLYTPPLPFFLSVLFYIYYILVERNKKGGEAKVPPLDPPWLLRQQARSLPPLHFIQEGVPAFIP